MVISSIPNGRLRIAFDLAKQQLNIEPLLDPHDIVKRPDKKSIVLYVMCMFHVLEERQRVRCLDQRNNGNGNSITTTVATPSAANNGNNCPTETATLIASNRATNSSAIVTEINAYQTSVENVLALLLEAENLLSGDVASLADLPTAKAQFERHEQFMIRMSTYQQYVGCALEEGARLLTDTQLSQELSAHDLGEIKQQMSLLNERWETLRMRALSMQTCVHERLASIQMRKVDELRSILTSIEDRVASMGELSSNATVMQRQLDEQRALEAHLQAQKAFVDDLSNLVVIVNDELFSDFEVKLNALGERWHHLIRWTEQRGGRLAEMRAQYAAVEGRFGRARDWVNAREANLKAMERDEVTDIGNIMQRINDVRYCSGDLLALTEVLVDLEQEAIGLESSDLLEAIEALSDRCEALKEILRAQQLRIQDMGLTYSPRDEQRSRIAVKRPEHWSEFRENAEDYKPNVEDTLQRRLDDACAVALDQLKEIDEIVARLRAQENNVAWKRDKFAAISQELTSKVHALDDLNALLDDNNEMSDMNRMIYAKLLAEIRAKYKETAARLAAALQACKTAPTETMRNSLTALKLVLADCRDWFKCNAAVASDAELSTRLEQMESLQVDIEKTEGMCRALNSAEGLDDLEQFLDSWEDLKENIRCRVKDMKRASVPNATDDAGMAQKCAALMHEIQSTTILKSILPQMHEHLKVFDKFHELYGELLRRVDEAAAPMALKNKCTAIQTALNEKIIKQTATVESLKHFHAEIEAAQLALLDLQQTFAADRFLPGDLPELYGTFGKYETYEQNLKKIEIDLISVRNFGDILRQDCTDELAGEIADHIAGLNAAYTAGLEVFRANVERLRVVIQRTEEMLQRIDQTELWLNELEISTPRLANAQIGSLNELFQLKTRFQALKETCDRHTEAFRELNEMGGEMLLQIYEAKQQAKAETTQWAKQFTKLNARWTDVTSRVYARTALLEHAYGQMGEFKKLVVSETGYLDRVEKCLRKSPEAAADAEEIYEELDVRR